MKYIARSFYILCFSIFSFYSSCAQPLNHKDKFTRQDTLRGSITPERAWWNVVSYNIYIAPDYKNKTIKGWNQVSFDINNDGKNKKMQIDLQQPMTIDSIIFNNKKIAAFKRDGNVYIIDFGDFNFVAARTALQRKIPVTLHSIKILFPGKTP
ncbi:MAG: hypothetical protein V9F01_14325 [Chitinophagaceae bacterium]